MAADPSAFAPLQILLPEELEGHALARELVMDVVPAGLPDGPCCLRTLRPERFEHLGVAHPLGILPRDALFSGCVERILHGVLRHAPRAADLVGRDALCGELQYELRPCLVRHLVLLSTLDGLPASICRWCWLRYLLSGRGGAHHANGWCTKRDGWCRLAGIITVLAEQDDIWAGKRYFSEERIAELSKERKPSLPPTPERLEELRETARKAIDASLELADGMETA